MERPTFIGLIKLHVCSEYMRSKFECDIKSEGRKGDKWWWWWGGEGGGGERESKERKKRDRTNPQL